MYQIAAVAALAIGSAVAQYMNSEQARQLNEQERKKLQELINKTQEPDFDFSTFVPEDYKLVQKFVPQTIPYIEAAAPKLIEQTKRGEMGRNSELDALQKYRQLSESGYDALTDIDLNRSSRRAASNAQSTRATTDQMMQRRGLGGGSGLEYASNLQGSSDAYMADALAGEQAAMDAAKRRDMALGNASNLGGKIGDQEFSEQQKNASILNDFNQWATQNKQNWAQNQANTSNDALKYNNTMAQNIANMSTEGRNSGRQNAIQNLNQLKQNQFANSLSKLGVQTSQADRTMTANNQGASQRNTGIQGVSQGAASAANAYQQYDDRKEDINQRNLDRQAGYYPSYGKPNPNPNLNSNENLLLKKPTR